MKFFIYIIMVVMLMGCAVKTTEISTPTTQCGMCYANIMDALNEVEGIKKVKINDEMQSVIIKYVGDKMTINDLEIVIANAGYQANDKPADSDAYGKLARCCRLPEDRIKN